MNTAIKAFRVFGLLAGLVLMAAFVIGGLALIGRAAIVLLRSTQSDAGTHEMALVQALSGIEYLFLAPLAFLVFLTLVRFVKKMVFGDINALGGYRVVKSLVINLMIAIIATDLVQKTVGQPGLTLNVACTELLVIVVFAGYVLLIERAGTRERREGQVAETKEQ